MLRLTTACPVLFALFTTPSKARHAKPVPCWSFDIMRPCGMLEMPDGVGQGVNMRRHRNPIETFRS